MPSRPSPPTALTLTLEAPPPLEPGGHLALPARYLDLGLLGSGGMGEVRRVWDRSLRRTLAMKILRADALHHPGAVDRFLGEAWTTAALQHPGIIGIHDHGVLDDGRPWLTMREVRGRTFAELYREDLAEPAGGEVRLRRRVAQLSGAAEAVAFAHANGVVHRDLKPQNLMVGEHGEVLVMDWGLAVAAGTLGAAGTPPPGEVDPSPTRLDTRPDQIVGSPGYIPPERARGQREATPAGDVYALGVVLHELLTGRRPARTSGGPTPRSIAEIAENFSRAAPPAELCALCARALADDPAERLPHAGALAASLRDWLDGVASLEQAEALVARADAAIPEIDRARAEAARLSAEADALLSVVPPHAPEDEKRPGWALQDAAARAEREALRGEMIREADLRSALQLVPTLSAAHERLAAHYRAACERARALHREDEVIRLEALVRAHDRGQHAAWLRGDGALDLDTDPPGVEVSVHRYARDGRRLVAEPTGLRLPTPLDSLALPAGSYRLDLRAPGRASQWLPVLIERGERWQNQAPGEDEPRPVALPPEGALADDERLIPAGWFLSGGDLEAAESLPRARLWLDAFIMQRDPVTNAGYLRFLNALVDEGREEEAIRWAPREHGQREGDPCLLGRDRDGYFVLRDDLPGGAWHPDWPVTMICWRSAMAYARWASALRGVPLRLPHELEWSKAASGVDGRAWPWGDHADPTWARMNGSLPDRMGRASVDAYPLDESPYGIRGMGGNVREWCANVYTRGGPTVVHGRPVLQTASSEDPGLRVVRGGCWASPPRLCRVATRFASRPEERLNVLGFRLVRDLPSANLSA